MSYVKVHLQFTNKPHTDGKYCLFLMNGDTLENTLVLVQLLLAKSKAFIVFKI